LLHNLFPLQTKAKNFSILFLIGINIFFIPPLKAQVIQRKFAVHSDTIRIDTFSIIANSIKIFPLHSNDSISSKTYLLDASFSILRWIKKPTTDSIRVFYRHYPYNFYKEFYHKKYSQWNNRKDTSNEDLGFYIPSENKNPFSDFGNLNYNGSFVRGISFGNTQDLVVNSAFNLQLNGMLASDVLVNAAITDNNVPLQPDGNTQQIQDFDKVYIQLTRRNTSLLLGDYDLAQPANSYFLFFLKKLEGVSFLTSDHPTKDTKLTIGADAAISKGKFASNTFLGQDGDQGPYKLTGADGETFIIILAGSERVYVDGQLLQRGANLDYVIDYNTAQVTFTPFRLITKDSRIEIEFQYSDQNYLRSFFYNTDEWSSTKWKVHLSMYSEQDNKNQPLQQEVSDSLLGATLSKVGDSVQNAFVPGSDSIAFDSTRVMYKRIFQPGFGYIFQYSTSKDSAHYAVSFSYVNPGKGDYVLSNSVANGSVYRWIAPVNGVHQGEYIPDILLPAPQKKQMITLGGEYHFNDSLTVKTEAALSYNNVNTFSTIDNKNNTGLASWVSFDKKWNVFPQIKQNKWQLDLNGSYEVTGQNFQPIERYRPVEFERDWNISDSLPAALQQLFHSAIGLHNLSEGFNYNISYYTRQSQFNGILQQLTGNYLWKGFTFFCNTSYLNTSAPLQTTTFFRPDFSLTKTIDRWTNGISFTGEDDRFRSGTNDTLQANSFRWHQWQYSSSNADTSKIKTGFSFSIRDDEQGLQNQFVPTTKAYTADAFLSILKHPADILNFKLTYRKLNVSDTTLSGQQSSETVLGHVDDNLNIKKGFITIYTLAEAGSGQQQKLQYSFVAVPPGQGVYMYGGDFNHNGVQDLDEFIVAPFPDEADYIKVFTPTNQFEKDYSVQYTQSININPKMLFPKIAGYTNFISRFSSSTSIQINKNTLPGTLGTEFNPFQLNVIDTVLISANAAIQSSIYFNRINPHFSTDITWQQNTAKSNTTSGFTSTDFKSWLLNARWGFLKQFTLLFHTSQNKKLSYAEGLTESNFNITSYVVEPDIQYLLKSNLRLETDYHFESGRNSDGEETDDVSIQRITFSSKYSSASQSSLESSFSFASVNYSGSENTAAQLTLLSGLEAGKNYLWDITYERKLNQTIELSLSYNGRKTGLSPVVNIGQAQVTALF
jgi:hypothetical protein